MGNEQSVNAHRSPNKLSKPRTNNHSTPSPNVNSFGTSSRHNSISTNGSPTKYQYCTVLGEEEVKEPKKKRMSIFRSKSSQRSRTSLPVDPGLDRHFAEFSPVDVPVRQWSRPARSNSMPPEHRANSMVIELPEPMPELQPERRPSMRSQRMSLQHVPYQQHHTRLSLVAELPSPEPEYPAGEKRVSGYKQLETADSRGSSRPIYGPIRRRSLQQPGIATRASFAENDSRQSLPSQIHSLDDLQTYFRHENEVTPAELQLPDRSEFPSQGARAHTPGDMDYGHIGAFKLGSLRITNGGAVSPVSSAERPGSAHDTSRKSEDHYPSPHRSNTMSQEVNKPWTVRSDSPLGNTVVREPLEIVTKISPSLALFDFEGTSNLLERTESPTKSLELAKEYMQDLAFSPFSFEASPPNSPQLEATSKHTAIEDDLFSAEPGTPTERDRLSRSFDSGYVGSLVPSNGFRGPREMTPKPLAKADSGYSSNMSLRSFKSRESPPVPPKEPLAPMETFSRVPSSSYSVASSAPSLPRSQGNYRVPSSTYSVASAQLDSTIQTMPQPTEAPPLPPKESFFRVPSSTYSVASIELPAPSREPVPRVPSSTYSVASTIPRQEENYRIPSSTYSVVSASSDLTIRTKQSLQSLPLVEVPEPFRQPPPIPPKHERQQIKRLEVPRKSIEQIPYSKHLRQKSLPASVQQASREESPANSEVSASSSNKSSRWKSSSKLNKRPHSMQPQVFTIQAGSTEELYVPSPSDEARRHLDQRVDEFPVACFPNTLSRTVGLRHTASKETLGTIFSVGSMEVKAELNFARLQSALPATPIAEDPTPISKPNFNRRNTFQVPPRVPVPERAQPRHSWNRMAFRQPFLRERSPAPALPQKSRQEQQADFEAQITSFDHIAASLGSSPYSVAMPAHKPNPRLATERAKSMTAQFEADASARYELSRQRNVNGGAQTTMIRVRNVSGGSQGSVVLNTRKSYDSISKGNPFVPSVKNTPNHSRTSSREYPPQAHSNRRSWGALPPAPPPVTQTSFPIQEQAQSSPVCPQKPKSPPPVSMQTQRKSLPAPSIASQLTAPSGSPPRRSPPVPPPNYTPPAPPRQSPISQSQAPSSPDMWARPKDFWASRRKSAGEALQARKSTDAPRPSMEGLGLGIHRSETAKPVSDYQRPRYGELGTRRSMDGYAERLRNASAESTGMRNSYLVFDTTQYSQNGNGGGWVDYDHTFGNDNAYQLKNQTASEEEEYYAPDEDTPEERSAEERIHQRKASTEEMMVLDGYTGGLGYGYEAGLGMGGTSMKSVGFGRDHGLDLIDVPVLLQPMRVQG